MFLFDDEIGCIRKEVGLKGKKYNKFKLYIGKSFIYLMDRNYLKKLFVSYLFVTILFNSFRLLKGSLF